MKLLVLKDFYDKETGELHKAGSVIELTKKRANELLKHKLQLVEKLED